MHLVQYSNFILQFFFQLKNNHFRGSYQCGLIDPFLTFNVYFVNFTMKIIEICLLYTDSKKNLV
jgi:hypothetical protein